jgi:hypothetical protein
MVFPGAERRAGRIICKRSFCWTKSEKIAVPRSDLHVCYALSIDPAGPHADFTAISALSVKRIYPTAKITVLADTDSLENFLTCISV